jgi:hypothetical protein
LTRKESYLVTRRDYFLVFEVVWNFTLTQR